MATFNKDRINFLIKRVEGKTVTPQELHELSALVNENETGEVAAYIETILNQNSSHTALTLTPAEQDMMVGNILQTDHSERTPVKVIGIWKKWAAAAAILIVCSATYLVFFNKTAPQKEIVKTNEPSDVTAPVTTKAVITLADGRTIAIDSIVNGTLAMQGDIKVSKTADGKIVYSESGSSPLGEAGVGYNTLSNPKGSKVASITLTDGTKVWLNAASSLKYFTSVGKDRRVEITGEAYFEVAHDAAKPFYVSKGEMTVQVLGTHFNVDAYDDNDESKITLLEGSVKISAAGESKIIKPGQQAQFVNDIKVVDANLEETMAWKNGFFHFESADLKTILRNVARWYDIEIIYEGAVSSEKYFSIINRNTSLANVLKSLQANDIKFRVEGNKLFVTKG